MTKLASEFRYLGDDAEPDEVELPDKPVEDLLTERAQHAERQATFETPGWERIRDDLQAEYEATKDQLLVAPREDIDRLRERARAYRQFLEMPDRISKRQAVLGQALAALQQNSEAP